MTMQTGASASKPLNRWQEKITINEVPERDLRDVLQTLFDHLGLDLIREAGPDYTAYEIRSRTE